MLVPLILAGVASMPVAAQEDEAPLTPIEIEFAEWGFDDRVVPRAFNLLSVNFRNSTDKPFEGVIRMRRLEGVTGSWTGAESIEPIYISPYGLKLLTFYPYILDMSDEFEIRWGESLNDSYVVEHPAIGNGARVIFNSKGELSGVTLGLRGFREELFPPSVTGTGELRIAVMDHTPKWGDARRTAFRDWLYLGGVLHVLHQSDRTFPELPVPELNFTLDDGNRPSHFGAGRVYWHERTRDDIGRKYAYEEIYPTSLPLVAVSGRDGSSFDVDPTAGDFYSEPERFYDSAAEWNSDDVQFRAMKAVVAPDHNWPLLYSLSLIYILLIFPGGWLLSRSKLDYRLNLLALLILVGSFGWLFSVLGARGYGERTSTWSLAIAHPLPNGRWYVQQRDSLFAAEGDNYAITHSGESLAYSTAQDEERVEGVIECGPQGSIKVDMPPFTFRTFAHETQFALGDWSLSISSATTEEVELPPEENVEQPTDPDLTSVDVSADALEWQYDLADIRTAQGDTLTLKTLQLSTKGTLPDRIHTALALYSGTFYRIDLDALRAGADNVLSEESEAVASVIRLLDKRHLNQRHLRIIGAEQTLDGMLPWLLASELRLRQHMDSFRFRLPADRIRLYLYADQPAELSSREASMPDVSLGTQAGRILYCIEQVMPDAD